MPTPNPDRTRRREGRPRRAAGACPTSDAAPPPGPFRLQTAQDVIDLLEEQVALVRAAPGAGALEKARTVGVLAGVALRAIEAGEVAARLEALEAALRHRSEGPG